MSRIAKRTARGGVREGKWEHEEESDREKESMRSRTVKKRA